MNHQCKRCGHPTHSEQYYCKDCERAMSLSVYVKGHGLFRTNLPKFMGVDRHTLIDNRPKSQSRIMIELDLIRQWSTCQRGRVASALVNRDSVILVPARNGTPYGQPTCRELGADPRERCQYCIHSEKNVINHAARLGVQTQGHDIFTLKRPCIGCANDIVQANISGVYYREDYDTDNQRDYVMGMFKERGIFVRQLEPTTEELSFSKMLEDWRATWTTT